MSNIQYHIEEKFKDIMAGDKVEIEYITEGTVDYVMYAYLYEIITANQIKRLSQNGFEIEYIEPGKDTVKGPYTRVRFRASPQ